MSIERNKKDFENELSNAKDSIELLEQCVDDAILEPIKGMIAEYEMHLQSDIEEMISKNQELEYKIDELENE